MNGVLERTFTRLGVEQSMTKRLRWSFVIILILLVIPVMIAVYFMASYSVSYHGIIMRMEQISELKPVVTETIPDDLFSIVAGRNDFADSHVWKSVESVNQRLDALVREGNTEMIVARRTMNTLVSYVTAMEEQISMEAPVAQSEALLEEVRSVAVLVGAMLDECINKEIASAMEASDRTQAIVNNVIVAEMLLLLLCIVFSIMAQRSLTDSIREPISRLETMAGNLAKGDLNARSPQTSTAELIPLTNSLNVMGGKLQTLIDENRREQENLKKSELRTLQAQIAPHFLYNTLDAIVWLAEENRSDEVIRITKALSDFFRISLSQGRDWITVGQERKHILGYLTIQRIRYRDVLDYEIDIPDDLDELPILKLVLQPLVENAIYHGIKHKRGGGKVTIRGREEDGELCFTVSDNGAGMTPERLRAVQAVLTADAYAESDAVGFGLYNVNKRIQLYYSQPEGLGVQSGPEGTVVSFRTPAQRPPEAPENRERQHV